MTTKYVETYKNICKFAELKTANIFAGKEQSHVNVKAVWSYRNIVSKSKTLVANDYIFDGSSVKSLLPSLINKDVILSTIHDNGMSAYMVQEKDKGYLLLSSKKGNISIINIEELELHGKIYTDENLASFCWSNDASHIVYIAEKKIPKPSSFFASNSEEKSKNSGGKGEENRYIDDWGEQMEGQHIGTIAVVNVDDLSVNVIDLPDDYLVGEVCWSHDGKHLYGLAYAKKAYRLGLIYCPIRENVLFSIDMKGNFKLLDPSEKQKYSMQSLRLSPNGKSLAYLRNPMGGPHVRSAQLCVLDIQTGEMSVIIDYVDVSVTDGNGKLFYGLYGCSNLAKNCWCSDGKRIFISTCNNFESVILLVDTDTRSFMLLGSSTQSEKVLDVKGDYVLISRSSLLKPTQILIGSTKTENATEIEFVQLNEDSEINIDSVEIYSEVCHGVSHPGTATDLPVPYLYLGPINNNRGKLPLIVLIHGGPHSVSLNSFSFGVLFFLKLGYSFVIPNYRGSLGQGRKYIESLPGYCGLADVTDVHACIQHCLERYGNNIDESHINVLGGSHGGFLGGHIAGQYPDLVHRVVLRNPVIELSSMQLTSDIPDWVFTESGIPYELGKIADGKQMTKMYEMSPLSHINNVKAPIMLQLGKSDKRVPYMQGLLYHKSLLARGIKTEAFVYDDCHPLSKVEVEADCFIHAARWFQSED